MSSIRPTEPTKSAGQPTPAGRAAIAGDRESLRREAAAREILRTARAALEAGTLEALRLGHRRVVMLAHTIAPADPVRGAIAPPDVSGPGPQAGPDTWRGRLVEAWMEPPGPGPPAGSVPVDPRGSDPEHPDRCMTIFSNRPAWWTCLDEAHASRRHGIARSGYGSGLAFCEGCRARNRREKTL